MSADEILSLIKVDIRGEFYLKYLLNGIKDEEEGSSGTASGTKRLSLSFLRNRVTSSQHSTRLCLRIKVSEYEENKERLILEYYSIKDLIGAFKNE